MASFFGSGAPSGIGGWDTFGGASASTTLFSLRPPSPSPSPSNLASGIGGLVANPSFQTAIPQWSYIVNPVGPSVNNGINLANLKTVAVPARSVDDDPPPYGTRPDTIFYANEYFSSTNMAIYIGDVFIDEITDLAFSVHANVRPVYGYRSKNFDLVLRDNVIVTGYFAINFKTNGYLYLVLNHYEEQLYSHDMAGVDPVLSAAAMDELELFDAADRPEQYRVNLETRKLFSELYDNNFKKSVKAKRKEIVKTLAGLRSGAANKDSYRRAVKKFQREIWHDAKDVGYTGKTFNFHGRDAQSENLQAGVLEQVPFNLIVQYGDVTFDAEHALSRKGAAKKRQDIAIYPDLDEYVPITTTKVIKNVIITTVEQAVDLSGRPVKEVYKFIARAVY